VDLYIHSPIRLHGVVLNSLSTGATLPVYLYEPRQSSSPQVDGKQPLLMVCFSECDFRSRLFLVVILYKNELVIHSRICLNNTDLYLSTRELHLNIDRQIVPNSTSSLVMWIYYVRVP
jgi:hypothetical protein